MNAWLPMLASILAGQGELLANPGFDAEPGPPGTLAGWSHQGDAFGAARVVAEPVVSGPRALELTVSAKGSTGQDSFMVFQVLPCADLRGHRLRFGARVKTEGAGANLVLYTPEGMANDLFSNPWSGDFRERSAVLDVPKNASFLSFGIQVLGKPGTRIVVDEAFVRLDEPSPGKVGAAAAGEDASGAVRVEVEAQRVEREVSPWLFGMHIEWVEGGLGLLEPDRPELRAAVMERLRPLHIPLFRFPGGILADYYDWHLGVGRADERGRSDNVFTGKQEVHRFGTPELASLLKASGAAALITSNFGTGSPEMAGQWAALLARQGVPAPMWEVGNEIYLSGPHTEGPNGSRIFKPGEAYARSFPAFRDAIRKAIPTAKVGAIGNLETGAFPMAPAENRDWTKQMLSSLRTPVDFVAVHDAYAPVIIDDSGDFGTEAARKEAYRSLYAAAEQVQENLDQVAGLVDRLSPSNRGVPLAVTEYGPLFGVSGRPGPQAIYVDQSRTLAAAIYVASVLDVFLGNPRVLAACYTNPIHRWYGSLLTDTDQGLVLTPTYHLFTMYRERFFRRLLPVRVASPTFAARGLGLVRKREGVPEVVARASLSDDGSRVGIMLVNRSVDRERPAELVLRGPFAASSFDCRVLTGPSPAAVNGPRLTATTVAGEIAPRPLACGGGAVLALRLPPNSVVSVIAERRK